MGHDIFGFNKAGQQIVYTRFSMGNYNCITLYSLLNDSDYNAGVSGSGDSTTSSTQQMGEALSEFKQSHENRDYLSENKPFDLDHKQIKEFFNQTN
ncbi:hypothetical protein [Alkalibacillus aidingensis]|uniref:hypothetical protein n=1 Tax=Alkalibacillus aidingensis TaxID=2747607 RepID=UPI001660912C|nr:hypothetical protein [Alkalibacillus aidingensis]